MQWLNTVDQPLLDEAAYWSERATAEATANPERTIEDNIQASMALQIAAQAPGSRQDMSVTIHNAATGNPTQITVYADGDGSTIHDVAPSIGGYLEAAASIVLNVAAVAFPETGLPFLAAAVDAAQAGQAFSNGEDVQGILSLAQAVGMGANGFGATQTAQIIAAASQGVGGVYGVVTSAENGNAAGILAGALEAAAAGATGIGLYESGQTQTTLNAIAVGLGTAGVATAVASDFASGNLGQGLVDSLNLYLPAVAQAYASYQDTLTFLDNGAWDTADAATSDPGWANNDQAGSGLNSGQLAAANSAGAGTAPVDSATLLAPTGLWFSNGDGVEPMSVPINDLLLPNFYHAGAQFLTADPGYFGVAGDGNPTTIIGPNGTQLDANQLATLIQGAGWQPGQPIQLFGCFTGAPTLNGGPDIAQQLANILNTEVIAPSTFGWVYPNGSFVIAPANDPSLDYNSSQTKLQASGPNLSATGNWHLFVPPSSSLINDLLNLPSGSGGIIKPLSAGWQVH